MKCGTGGAGVESFAEGTVKISEIFLKVIDTAVLQSLVMSHRYKKSIEDSMNKEVKSLLISVN